MEQMDGQQQRTTGVGVFKGLALALILSLVPRFSRHRDEDREGQGNGSGQEERFRRLVIQGWVIVCGLSILLVLYGFFAFFMVGDKGPPEWDFGAVPDVPGESIYSTYPSRGRTEQPPVQHVDEKPPGLQPDISDRPPRKTPETGEGDGKDALR